MFIREADTPCRYDYAQAVRGKQPRRPRCYGGETREGGDAEMHAAVMQRYTRCRNAKASATRKGSREERRSKRSVRDLSAANTKALPRHTRSLTSFTMPSAPNAARHPPPLVDMRTRYLSLILFFIAMCRVVCVTRPRSSLCENPAQQPRAAFIILLRPRRRVIREAARAARKPTNHREPRRSTAFFAEQAWRNAGDARAAEQ